MSRKYKFHSPEDVYPVKSRRELFHRVYFVLFAVQEWGDVFTRNDYKNILIEKLGKYSTFDCQTHNRLFVEE